MPTAIHYPMLLAPPQHAPPAEAAVAAEHDLGFRPSLAQTLDQQAQDRPGMPGRIDVARPQVRHQKLGSTEHVERKEAVVVVVAMKEPSLLLPMHRVIRRIEVQNDTLRSPLVGGNELLDHLPVDRYGHLSLGTVLEPAQRRGTGQGTIAFHSRLQQRVMSQGIMIIQIFVAQRQAVHALPHHLQVSMPATALHARIRKLPRDSAAQTNAAICRP